MDKTAARTAAFARRKAAHRPDVDHTLHLAKVLERYQGAVIAGYMPMRTEIDPLLALTAHERVGMPVIMAPATPLQFRQWTPGCALIKGAFGAMIPAKGDWVIPDVVVVPLVAFDRQGGRLGYGGGFYDRTLEQLRAAKETIAIGFAYSAQEADALPLEPTDQPLDLIVTENEIITPPRSSHV